MGDVVGLRCGAFNLRSDHDLMPAADLLHGDEQVVYDDAGYQGFAKRPEMDGTQASFRVAMRSGKRRALTDTPQRKPQDLIETAKTNVCSKVEHPFGVMKQQFSFQKTRLCGLAKYSCKVHVLSVLQNLYRARGHLLAETCVQTWCDLLARRADQEGIEKPLITGSGPDSGLNGTEKPDQFGFAGPSLLKSVLLRDSLGMNDEILRL
jgi:hypothetical protein